MKSRLVVTRSPRQREPVLWVVDSEQWPRVCLRAELIERGYDPYGFIAIDDALDALAHGTSTKPEALILELRGQNLTEQLIKTLRNLQVPTILLGGSAELNDAAVRNERWDIVLKRPVSLGQIADVVPIVIAKRAGSGKR